MWTKILIFFALYAVCVDSETFYKLAGSLSRMRCIDPGKGGLSWSYGSSLIVTRPKRGNTRKGTIGLAERATLNGDSLQINNLELGDSGTYTCTVDTGAKIEHTLQVVKVSVSVSPASPLLLSSKATLVCDVEGLSPTEVKWKHQNSTFAEKSVTINSVEVSHRGKWTCQVKHRNLPDGGEASLDIDVIDMIKHGPVTVKQDAKAVLPCTLSTSNLGSLEVVRGGWRQLNSVPADAPRLPSLNTNTKELQWNGTDIGASKVIFSKDKLKTDLSITLLKVKTDQAGNYECYVEFKGRRPLKAEVTLTVNEKANPPNRGSGKTGATPSWRGLSIWHWVGVGAGSVAVIALVIAVVLVHKSNKRRKMRMRKLRSVRKPLTANDYCQCNRQPPGENMNRPVRVPRQQRVPENLQLNGGYGGRPRM